MSHVVDQRTGKKVMTIMTSCRGRSSGSDSAKASARIRCTLKTPYRDGTTHMLFEPLDFLSSLETAGSDPGERVSAETYVVRHGAQPALTTHVVNLCHRGISGMTIIPAIMRT